MGFVPGVLHLADHSFQAAERARMGRTAERLLGGGQEPFPERLSIGAITLLVLRA